MKLSESLVAWNPDSNQVKVGPLLHERSRDWTLPYKMSAGAAYAHVRELHGLEAQHYVMSEFIAIVIRDRVDLDAAHKEFLKIEEYRNALPEDV